MTVWRHSIRKLEGYKIKGTRWIERGLTVSQVSQRRPTLYRGPASEYRYVGAECERGAVVPVGTTFGHGAVVNLVISNSFFEAA